MRKLMHEGYKNTILIIEDDDEFADSLSSSIVKIDPKFWRVVSVRDDYNAMGAIEMMRIDLIILDMHLGSTDAMTLLNELASYNDTLAIPKIILSSSGRDINVDDLADFGVRAVYDKRYYDLKELLADVKQLVREYRHGVRP